MERTEVTVAALPRLLTHDDGRGRVVDMRVLVKDWCANPQSRLAMITELPRRRRWHDRFTRRRRDLPRIAALVHNASGLLRNSSYLGIVMLWGLWGRLRLPDGLV